MLRVRIALRVLGSMALVVVVGVSMSGCAVKPRPQMRLTLEGSGIYGSELVVMEAGEVQALVAGVRNELGANPALLASVSRAAVDWVPAIRDLGRGEPVRLQISPAMASCPGWITSSDRRSSPDNRSSSRQRPHADQSSSSNSSMTHRSASAVESVVWRGKEKPSSCRPRLTLEGLSGPEIAELEGVTANAIWVRLHRARTRFARAAEALEVER